MFQGFYCATSGVLTQTRDLNVISNNMANISTPGFKSDTFISRSFEEELAYRSQNKAQVGAEEVGMLGRGVGTDRNYTSYMQGSLQPTNHPFDFALNSTGFFEIQGAEGNVYTRNGSFSLDGEGYLTLQGVGRVLDSNGQPILLGTDKISSDSLGNIFDERTDTFVAKIGVVDFADYENDLVKDDIGVFIASVAPTQIDGQIMHKAYEKANVEAVDEMANMMASQRALQSSAEILRLYDQIMNKVTNELSPV